MFLVRSEEKDESTKCMEMQRTSRSLKFSGLSFAIGFLHDEPSSFFFFFRFSFVNLEYYYFIFSLYDGGIISFVIIDKSFGWNFSKRSKTFGDYMFIKILLIVDKKWIPLKLYFLPKCIAWHFLKNLQRFITTVFCH